MKDKDKKDKSKDKDKNKSEESSKHTDEIKRLNRIAGQIDGIKKMLHEERDLGDILIQCKAIHSALKSIESRIFERYAGDSVDEITKSEKKKPREKKIEELLELFKYV